MNMATVFPASIVSKPRSLHILFSSATSCSLPIPRLAPSAHADSYSKGETCAFPVSSYGTTLEQAITQPG